ISGGGRRGLSAVFSANRQPRIYLLGVPLPRSGGTRSNVRLRIGVAVRPRGGFQQRPALGLRLEPAVAGGSKRARTSRAISLGPEPEDAAARSGRSIFDYRRRRRYAPAPL